MSNKLQLGVFYLGWGGAVWWIRTEKRQIWFVWVAGKTVWSPCDLSALEMRFMTKRYINRRSFTIFSN